MCVCACACVCECVHVCVRMCVCACACRSKCNMIGQSKTKGNLEAVAETIQRIHVQRY